MSKYFGVHQKLFTLTSSSIVAEFVSISTGAGVTSCDVLAQFFVTTLVQRVIIAFIHIYRSDLT